MSAAVDRAVVFLHECGDMLVEKNAKYGDSAANPMRVFSRASTIEQLLVRIDDKLSRIARGAGFGTEDEDTVKDLVGYLALLHAVSNVSSGRPALVEDVREGITIRVGTAAAETGIDSGKEAK